MTDHEDHDTDLASTAAAELAGQTTELPPANHAAATPEARSLDDTAEVDSAPPRSRFVWAGLMTLVVVIAGALIFLAATLFISHRSSPQPLSETRSASDERNADTGCWYGDSSTTRASQTRAAFPGPGPDAPREAGHRLDARAAVFVDGCFWHRCPDHWTAPKNNGECIAVSAIAQYSIDMTVLLPLIKGATGA
jgi:hypothetical protein